MSSDNIIKLPNSQKEDRVAERSVQVRIAKQLLIAVSAACFALFLLGQLGTNFDWLVNQLSRWLVGGSHLAATGNFWQGVAISIVCLAIATWALLVALVSLPHDFIVDSPRGKDVALTWLALALTAIAALSINGASGTFESLGQQSATQIIFFSTSCLGVAGVGLPLVLVFSLSNAAYVFHRWENPLMEKRSETDND